MRPTPLTVRIAGLLMTAAAAVCGLTAIAVEQVLARELTHREAAELVGKVALLRHLLHERVGAVWSPQSAQLLEDALYGHEGLGLVMMDADGRVLLRAGADLESVEPAAPLAVSVDRAPSVHDVRLVEQGAAHWRLLTAEAALAGGEPLRLMLGRDAHSGESMRSTVRTVMLATMLTAAFGTALIGWVALWRGLRPLAAMAEAARRITAQRLTERVQVVPHAAREVRELAEAFNGMIDRLEEGFVRLSRFSADLAHDLRTPLASLLLQTQVGLSKARSADEYQALLAANMSEFERLQRMVDAMLFLARADNAQVALRREPLELRRELDRLAEYFELAAEERGVRIVASGRAQLHADAALLARALGNLVANAIRHASSGSVVRLRAATDGDYAVAEVTNEGEGIAAADLPHLFDRFWRGDRARSASEASSGLGLSIVRSITHLHGGDVQVESSQAGPTTFRLRLPTTPGSPAEGNRAAKGAAPASRTGLTGATQAGQRP